MFLVAFNRRDLAVLTMRYCENFRVEENGAKGYKPYASGGPFSNAYAGSEEGVWSEGTFGVVLAKRSIGDLAGAIADYANMAPAQEYDGYRYTTSPDETFQLQNWHNVAGTGWAVMAADPQGFWENTFPSLWETVISPSTVIIDPTTPGSNFVPIFGETGGVVAVTRDGTQTTTYVQRG
jgi:hypothetical protein